MMSEPPIDSVDFNERTLGNAKLKAELLGLFQQHAPGLLTDMRHSVDGNDYVAAARTAHRLAGSAATVSAKGLSRQFRAIEEALTAGDGDWAQAALPAAADLLSACLRQVERLRDRLE